MKKKINIPLRIINIEKKPNADKNKQKQNKFSFCHFRIFKTIYQRNAVLKFTFRYKLIMSLVRMQCLQWSKPSETVFRWFLYIVVGFVNGDDDDVVVWCGVFSPLYW